MRQRVMFLFVAVLAMGSAVAWGTELLKLESFLRQKGLDLTRVEYKSCAAETVWNPVTDGQELGKNVCEVWVKPVTTAGYPLQFSDRSQVYKTDKSESTFISETVRKEVKADADFVVKQGQNTATTVVPIKKYVPIVGGGN